jgi:hypothetical protein
MPSTPNPDRSDPGLNRVDETTAGDELARCRWNEAAERADHHGPPVDIVVRWDAIESQVSGRPVVFDCVRLFRDPLTHRSEIDANAHQYLKGNTLSLPDHSQEDVLGADVVAAELHCLSEG